MQKWLRSLIDLLQGEMEVMDSLRGFSEWQNETIKHMEEKLNAFDPEVMFVSCVGSCLYLSSKFTIIGERIAGEIFFSGSVSNE